jgi:hypothetical protein
LVTGQRVKYLSEILKKKIHTDTDTKEPRALPVEGNKARYRPICIINKTHTRVPKLMKQCMKMSNKAYDIIKHF